MLPSLLRWTLITFPKVWWSFSTLPLIIMTIMKMMGVVIFILWWKHDKNLDHFYLLDSWSTFFSHFASTCFHILFKTSSIFHILFKTSSILAPKGEDLARPWLNISCSTVEVREGTSLSWNTCVWPCQCKFSKNRSS